jgi:murein DD-endopeptidase MepM/ murein hydrolase activator NlpD
MAGLTFVSILVPALPAHADDLQQKQSSNKAKQQQVQGQLNLATASDDKIEAEANRLAAAARVQQARADSARQAQQAVAVQIDQAAAHLDELQQRQLVVRQHIVEAAVAAYVAPPRTAPALAAAGSDIAEMSRSQTLLDVVQAAAADTVDALRASSGDVRKAQKDLERLEAEATQRTKAEQDQAAKLKAAQQTQDAAHAALQGRISELQNESKSLAAQDAQLVALIRQQQQAAAAALAAQQAASAGSRAVSGAGLIWPLHGPVTSEYGYRWGALHPGIDIAPPYGTPIAAAKSGVVIQAGPYYGYGNFVMIDHGGGMVTGYGHQSRIAVTQGQTVRQGQIIGYVGSTGDSTGPHLHFEVRINGSTQNPRNYLSGNP